MYCCKELEEAVKNDDRFDDSSCPPSIVGEWENDLWRIEMKYCIFCGTKFNDL